MKIIIYLNLFQNEDINYDNISTDNKSDEVEIEQKQLHVL